MEIDLLKADIDTARRGGAAALLPTTPRFQPATCEDPIEYPEDSFDIMLCFDAVEHISG